MHEKDLDALLASVYVLLVLLASGTKYSAQLPPAALDFVEFIVRILEVATLCNNL